MPGLWAGPTLPAAAQYTTGVVKDGLFYVLGGSLTPPGSSAYASLASVGKYDLHSNSWWAGDHRVAGATRGSAPRTVVGEERADRRG